ncbi:MAG: hypothetical protein HKM95_11595 [Inquilinus sp.]|nr:hypothetical protein [Inquilinus sp.]
MPNPTTIAELVKLSKSGKPGGIDNWGDDGVNCYAFAVNCPNPKNGKPNPGGAARPAGGWTNLKLAQGAEADGLKKLGWPEHLQKNKIPNGYHLVAGYVSEDGGDHHWYRQDPATGYWVHKPGANQVKNFGAKIGDLLGTDLSKFDHAAVMQGTKYVFADYFLCPSGGLKI